MIAMKELKVKIVRDFRRHKFKYLLIMPVLVYLILFCYKPMYGIVIAFQNYRPALKISGSQWVGFFHFQRAFSDPYFWRALKNTVVISMLVLVFSFPAPILLALLLNEVKVKWFGRVVQTITYMPHFIALVVICGLINTFSQTGGLFNDIVTFFGGNRENLLANPTYFYPIYILSNIWSTIGWNSIIYMATLAGIDQEQYEAARIDGAGRMAQMLHITLPGIIPTAAMLLVLQMGSVLNVGYEKILLLYQPLTYEVADVLSTFVYRKGLIDADYSFSTAVNLFNSVVNILFLLAANRGSKKLGQSGLF